VLCGFLSIFVPHHEISFDGNWFLRILVPPIIFEAALSIDKKSFRRHLLPIVIFAVFGTLLATLLTSLIVHYGTVYLSPRCTVIPIIESLTYGALISSIDPIAVLSVLSSMGMTDTDTIYVLIFGESLLNDGVAIVLFNTLVHFLDENLIIDQDVLKSATLDFFIIAFGSLFIGIASGWLSKVYFWAFYGCQTPLVEMLMFFCWALLPYYLCDLLDLSGIVGTVAVGFCMDIHVIGERDADESNGNIGLNNMTISENGTLHVNEHFNGKHASKQNSKSQDIRRQCIRRPLRNKRGHLSVEAKTHIRVVVEIVATAMETAIFAYLGFFLFSNRYNWNVYHVIIAICGCCLSRAIMIPMLSITSNGLTRIYLHHRDRVNTTCQCNSRPELDATTIRNGYPGGVFIDRKMGIALWFAGLRGAMSFALVEYIPIYDSYSGEGTKLKPELKAMTSSSILFTMFVLGGYTYYLMTNLGIAPSRKESISAKEDEENFEMTSLMTEEDELPKF
jgi:NhaP-type Na+/H+ or K+/H+ antiporter